MRVTKVGVCSKHTHTCVHMHTKTQHPPGGWITMPAEPVWHRGVKIATKYSRYLSSQDRPPWTLEWSRGEQSISADPSLVFLAFLSRGDGMGAILGLRPLARSSEPPPHKPISQLWNLYLSWQRWGNGYPNFPERGSAENPISLKSCGMKGSCFTMRPSKPVYFFHPS